MADTWARYYLSVVDIRKVPTTTPDLVNGGFRVLKYHIPRVEGTFVTGAECVVAYTRGIDRRYVVALVRTTDEQHDVLSSTSGIMALPDFMAKTELDMTAVRKRLQTRLMNDVPAVERDALAAKFAEMRVVVPTRDCTAHQFLTALCRRVSGDPTCNIDERLRVHMTKQPRTRPVPTRMSR